MPFEWTDNRYKCIVMTPQKYYYIGWPSSQFYIDLDPDGEHWAYDGDGGYNGIFALCDWVEKVNREN